MPTRSDVSPSLPARRRLPETGKTDITDLTGAAPSGQRPFSFLDRFDPTPSHRTTRHMTITSPHNPRLKELRKLARAAQRAHTGLFAAEGEDLVLAASHAGRRAVEG